MVNIIIRESNSNRFKPHWNSSMQKYYHTKDDYLGDLKKHNLEPYKGPVSRKAPPKYKPSKWAHNMVNAINKRGDGTVPGEVQKELREKTGNTARILKDISTKNGGWF